MTTPHTPKIRKPTPEELDGMIDAVEKKGWYGLLGALLDYKQLRKEKEAANELLA
jgi:hypothetical protein